MFTQKFVDEYSQQLYLEWPKTNYSTSVLRNAIQLQKETNYGTHNNLDNSLGNYLREKGKFQQVISCMIPFI